MRNTEVFNDFDMVVCVPQDTINSQLAHLTKMDTIKQEFILIQTVQEVNGKLEYVYKVAGSPAEVPVDPRGNPTAAYIDGQILPQVLISQSGTDVTFVLQFRGGTAYFWVGSGPLAKLTKYDMTGWSYGIDVNLDLVSIVKDDIGKKIAVPANVEQQFTQFLDNMFSVRSLFMDFESTDLTRFNPVHSNAGSAGDPGLQSLVLFMEFYLKYLQASGNPYILGYALSPGDNTKYKLGEEVPAQLSPVGTTFTMYHDPTNPGLSNLNFVLATKGGHGSVSSTPGNFDSNWISPNEQCDAKMIYSHSCLVEPFVLQPFYEQLKQEVYDKIHDHLDVGVGNPYAAGRAPTPTGFSYTISDVASGADRYVNTYSAVLTTANGSGSSSAQINLSGHLDFYKQVKREGQICGTAEAHAEQSAEWSSTIQITSAKDPDGHPSLQFSYSGITLGDQKHNSDHNACAEFMKILGVIGDIISGFAGGVASLSNVLEIHVPGLGDVSNLFSNLGSSIAPAVLMPAGDEFFYKNPAIDPEGNLYPELTYKSES